MKRVFLGFLVSFALLIISNVESKGQCETGYTSKTVTIQAGNCDYIVEVCYKCELHHPGIVKINKWWQLDSTCINALDIDLVLGQIYQEISDGAFILTNFCTDGLYNTPPCGSGYNEFKIYHSYCWQQWQRWNGITWVREYWPCEENATCEVIAKVCFNTTTQQFETTYSYGDPETPPCELEWYEITLPGRDQKSECFILNSVPCGVE